jgi:hypothetical protein
LQTDRTNPNNKPDIIIRDNEKGAYMPINVAILVDRNVIKKETEKFLRYKDLTIRTQRMWNVKRKGILLIIGATETILKSFRKHLNNIPGKHEIKELQNIALLGAAHTIRKVQKQEFETFIMGNNITYTTNFNCRVAETLYTQETWFVAGT